jgi:hypothetical protein
MEGIGHLFASAGEAVRKSPHLAVGLVGGAVLAFSIASAYGGYRGIRWYLEHLERSNPQIEQSAGLGIKQEDLMLG